MLAVCFTWSKGNPAEAPNGGKDLLLASKTPESFANRKLGFLGQSSNFRLEGLDEGSLRELSVDCEWRRRLSDRRSHPGSINRS